MLSHRFAEAGGAEAKQLVEELAAARAEYAALRGELDAAKASN